MLRVSDWPLNVLLESETSPILRMLSTSNSTPHAMRVHAIRWPAATNCSLGACLFHQNTATLYQGSAAYEKDDFSAVPVVMEEFSIDK